jgi:hypothetical protein
MEYSPRSTAGMRALADEPNSRERRPREGSPRQPGVRDRLGGQERAARVHAREAIERRFHYIEQIAPRHRTNARVIDRASEPTEGQP